MLTSADKLSKHESDSACFTDIGLKFGTVEDEPRLQHMFSLQHCPRIPGINKHSELCQGQQVLLQTGSVWKLFQFVLESVCSVLFVETVWVNE